MYELLPSLSRDLILKYVTREEILTLYTGHNALDLNSNFSSPYRKDKHPSCCYYIDISGQTKVKDFATGRVLDAFALVQEIHKCDFFAALMIIAKDFGIAYEDCGYIQSEQRKTEAKHIKRTPKPPAQIKIQSRDWTKKDIAFWKRFEISLDTLKLYNVKPLSMVLINNKISYIYSESDPAYSYEIQSYNYKIYFPFRQSNRFLSNTSYIQGYRQLPKVGDHVVITKSMKDVMSLYEYGINACATQAESVIIKEDFYNHLKTRFDSIYILYDNDFPGKRGTLKTIKQYPDIIPLQIPDRLSKDFSGFVENYGNQETIDLINYTKLLFET